MRVGCDVLALRLAGLSGHSRPHGVHGPAEPGR